MVNGGGINSNTNVLSVVTKNLLSPPTSARYGIKNHRYLSSDVTDAADFCSYLPSNTWWIFTHPKVQPVNV